MKIVLPEDIGEITLSTFQDYTELLKREDLTPFQFNKRKVSVFTKIRYTDLNNINEKDFNEIIEQIDRALNVEKPFVQRFKLNDQEFGFIPNFDKMTTKEFVDLSLYPVENIEDMHKLMAILFRPITRISFSNYEIEPYNGTGHYADVMKGMTMNIVHGSLFFFWNLSEILLINTQKYTKALEQKKDQERLTSLESGVGTELSLN